MKRNLSLTLMAGLLICSCQMKELEPEAASSKIFYATIENNEDTKTSLDNNGNVLWKQGDQVSVFDGSTINKQYQVTDASDGKTSAALNAVGGGGYAAGTEIENNVAFYPYAEGNAIAKNAGNYQISYTLPATQDYAAGSFGNGAFPMAAVTSSTSDQNLTFKNILGALALQLKGTATISSISIIGNNDEILCGAATVTASNGNAPTIALSDASAKTVTLSCGAGVALNTTTVTTFTIALPPMTMTGGFTVTVTDTQGKQMEISTSKSQTITRSNRLVMPELTYAGTAATPTYEYVDLGLSVKWATMNVGATTPEGYGDYFAWGATEPWYEDGYAQETPGTHWKAGKSGGYIWTNAPYQTANTNTDWSTKWTKYLWEAASEFKDAGATDTDAEKNYLDMVDDAARVNWGGNWRMPTVAEWDELRNTNNCTWTWTTLNGVNGYKVQSKKAGYTEKWIFLPAAGHRVGDGLGVAGDCGFYWSSRVNADYPFRSLCLYFNPVSIYQSYQIGDGYNHGDRSDGQSVRPVSE